MNVNSVIEQVRKGNPRTNQKIELKSLILAQIERWRHALHMQVERERGGNPFSRVANG